MEMENGQLMTIEGQRELENKRMKSALSVKGFCGWPLSLTLRFEPVWNLNGED